MFVKSTMKPNYQCYSAKPEDSLESVLEQLEKRDIEAMPVVEGELFVGMISKQTIYQAFFASNKEKEVFLKNRTAGDIKTNDELYINKDEVFEKTLTTFKGFPILAVAEKNRKFLGIVTRYDVIEQFESAFGTKKKGVRIAFTSEESAGRLSRFADIIKHFHSNVISLTTFDETDKLARRIVLKIDKSDHVEKLAKRLEKSGFRVLDIKEV